MTAQTDTPNVSRADASDISQTSPDDQAITVRAETAADAEWVEQLHALAFGPGRFARAAFRVRERLPADPGLSLVAEIEGTPVSSVHMTPISIDGENGYLLGPLATDPANRNKGAGKHLVRAVTARALERGEGKFVLLVGDAPYYAPLGFRPTRKGAIRFPGPVDPARILAHCVDGLDPEQLSGTIAPFRAG